MIRQPMLRLRAVGRVTVGLLGVASALLLAPPAVAQPDVDANNAITAAWQASGADTGPLGAPSGGVYPVGAGFAQNFAAGKMFFTPATGAHFMQGAILEKYESLGGPADGDLGFPTIDEGPGRAPDSRNSTLGGPDNPVIFWTPGTGARVVRGAVNAAWDRLGGSSGPLGVPAEDETYNGAVVTQKFTGGEISYDSRAKTFTTVPPDLAAQLADLSVPDNPVAAINAARRAAGGPLGPLGDAEGEPYPIGSDGMGQDFVNGAIFYSPDTGANVVTGQVLAKYESVGGPEGDLGFPISGEQDGGLAPSSRMSAFAAQDKPVIFWTPDHGAFIVRGAMNAAWAELGGATGELGAPVADETQNGTTVTQRFNGGAISWDSATGRFSTEPASLASQLAGVEVPGAGARQENAPSSQASTDADDSGLKWNNWWLIALVPLLLLAGLVAVAVMRNRSRRDDDDAFAVPGSDESGYGPAGFSGSDERDDHRGDDSSGEDALFGDRYAREGLGSLAAAGPATAAATYRPEPVSFWGAPVHPESDAEDADADPGVGDDDPDAVDTAPTRIQNAGQDTADESIDSDPETGDHVREPDKTDLHDADLHYGELDDAELNPAGLNHEELDDAELNHEEPTGAESAGDRGPVAATAPLRDPLVDTGRHARIDIDDPMPLGTALHMPFDDPRRIPDGYPIKADTRSGLYWLPDSADYDEAPVELWFASEEIARTNGFVRGE